MNGERTYHRFFIGIGGIGMSAIARYYLKRGFSVGGYDRYRSPLCQLLEAEGADITYEDEISNAHRFNDQTVVIYTPAIPENSAWLKWCNDRFAMYKRSEELGRLTTGTYCLAVAGTHGKTTTSSMLAQLVATGNKPVAVFLGGISANFNSNFYEQDGKGDEKYTVVEADEYDRSFLRLSPTAAIITSTDSDHLDIYGEGDQVKQAFQEFAQKVSDSKKLFTAASEIEGVRYGLNKDAEITARDISWNQTNTTFTYYSTEQVIEKLTLPIPGRHNLENALGAISMALGVGVSENDIRKGLAEFKGIKRRFELVFSGSDLVVYDDYAHHPTEIEAVIQSIRDMYPDQKVTAVFQPHLFSRTRDFAEGFADALSLADQVILNPIYPARELPMEGITEMTIGGKMNKTPRYVDRDAWVDWIDDIRNGVLLILGAGDIDHVVAPIVEHLNRRT